MAHLGQTRSAQAWAKVFAESIEDDLHKRAAQAKGDLSQVLPLLLSSLEPVSKGRATRMCQEINLAKKQYDAREIAKRDESRDKLDRIAASGGEAGPGYTPKIIAWALHSVLLQNDEYILSVAVPTGRKRAKGFMLDVAINFAESLCASSPEVKARPDPLAAYTADLPLHTIAPRQEIPLDTSDPQEALLAKYMKGE